MREDHLVGDDALIVPPHMLIAIGKWVDVGIDPYRFLRRFSEYPGDCDRRESLEGVTSTFGLLTITRVVRQPPE